MSVRALLTMTGVRGAGRQYAGTDDDNQPVYDVGGTVILEAVYNQKDSSENEAWSAATPSATLEMHVSNPAAFKFFKPGHRYYVDFTPVGD